MLRPILGGCVLGSVAFFLAVGFGSACGASQPECKLGAVSYLPDDPMAVTPYDVSDLVSRLRACEVSGDAGR